MCNNESQLRPNITLKKLLSEKKIVIPKIQRDYAMGRVNNEETEKRIDFLRDIYFHAKDGTDMVLDYVYGNTKTDSDGNESFYPLDGQQRLTTLWLIHWYLLVKTGLIQKEEYSWIKNFSYETRASSSKFCNKICNLRKEDYDALKKEDVCVRDYIVQQHWFYSEWIQDSTINSMLRTISGDNDTNNRSDCIEGVFINDTNNGGTSLKSLLENCITKIKFNLLEISETQLPFTDDLYVKMNARGKRLTNFENFKADLITSIDNDRNYSARIDNEWTNVFWKSRDDKNSIDDSFFLFINSFVLNKLIEKSGFKNEDNIGKDDTIKYFFKKLYTKDKTNGHIITYTRFEEYSKYLSLNNELPEIDRLLDFIDKHANNISIKSIDEDDDNTNETDDDQITLDDFNWIPTRDKDGKLEITQKYRVYLYSLSCFLNRVEWKTDNTEQKSIIENYNLWYRVIHNIIENSGISTVDAMISCMKMIHGLSLQLDSKNTNIYEILSNYVNADKLLNDKLNNDFNSNANTEDSSASIRMEQLKEEVWKAYLICKKTWSEELISEAENWEFFNGSIRFLLRNENGLYIDDLNSFNNKLEKAKILFPKDCKNTVPIKFMDRFRDLFTSLDEVCSPDINLFSSVGYKTRGFSWKTFMCNDKYSKQINDLLTNDLSVNQKDRDYEALLKNKDLILWCEKRYANNKKKDLLIQRAFNDCYYIHQKNSKTDYIYIYEGRKERCDSLRSLQGITVGDSNELVGGYYWGKHIKFSYKDNPDVFYLWKAEESKLKCVENRIYCVKANDDETESKNWYCWSDINQFIDELKNFKFEF